MKIESILGSKLAMVTGWGTGLAILFVLFGSKVNLAADALRALDTSLALCLAVFTFLGFSAVSAGFSDINKVSAQMALNAPSGKVQGWLFSMVLLLCGWFILDAPLRCMGR